MARLAAIVAASLCCVHLWLQNPFSDFFSAFVWLARPALPEPAKPLANPDRMMLSLNDDKDA
jgi:hypothetical protein